ncbi:MAG: ATP-binding protein [Neisseria sp.]|nr:ATP-binding protein [Neisseria sp.]
MNQPLSQHSRRLRRYLPITLSVTVFLLLIGAILLFNYSLSNKLNMLTHHIDATGEISDESYNLVYEIQRISLQTNQAAESTSYPVPDLSYLQETTEYIQELFNILESGGLYGEEEDSVMVDALKDSTQIEQLQVFKNIWSPYQQLLTQYMNAASPDVQQIYLGQLVAYAQEQKQPIYDTLDRIIDNLTNESQSISQQVRGLQIAGISLIVLFFSIFIFYFIRQMIKADAKLEEAREETLEILTTVSTGLFLLDESLTIGGQYSKELETIIGKREIGGQQLETVLADMLSPEKQKSLKLFVQQLYNPRVVENLIHGLNPLRQVDMTVDDFHGSYQAKTLSFRFSRVVKNQKITKVLVNVSDLTTAVKLEKQLAQEQAQSNLQIEMISTILNTDYFAMKNFIQTSLQRLNTMNNVLQEPEKSAEAMRQKIRAIYREIHSFKSESSAFHMRSFVSLAEQFEDKVRTLQDKPDLTGQDFLALTIRLEDLFNNVHLANNLHQRIKAEGEKSEQQAADTAVNSLSPSFFEQFITDVAQRNHKQVALTYEAWNESALPENQKNVIKDILIQLLRNAVVHGIENHNERARLGKPTQGHILVSLDKVNDKVELMVEDDGQGIDYEAIRQKAIRHHIAPEDEVQTWNKQQLLTLLFRSGFSTAEDNNEDAGRGVGLDIIKEQVQSVNGRLKIATVANKFTKFTITI